MNPNSKSGSRIENPAQPLFEGEPDLEHLYYARHKLKKDPERALQELTWLACRGSVMSMIYLGEAFSQGTAGVLDFERAKNWYKRAADRGSALAEHLLAHVYLKTGAVDQALNSFMRSAARNYPPSIYMLGRMYFWGMGVQRNPAEGARLLELATKLGSIPAKGALAKYLVTNNLGVKAFLRGVWLGTVVRIQLLYFLLLARGPKKERLRM